MQTLTVTEPRQIEWVPYQTMDPMVEIEVAANTADRWRHRPLDRRGEPSGSWRDGRPK